MHDGCPGIQESEHRQSSPYLIAFGAVALPIRASGSSSESSPVKSITSLCGTLGEKKKKKKNLKRERATETERQRQRERDRERERDRDRDRDRERDRDRDRDRGRESASECERVRVRVRESEPEKRERRENEGGGRTDVPALHCHRIMNCQYAFSFHRSSLTHVQHKRKKPATSSLQYNSKN